MIQPVEKREAPPGTETKEEGKKTETRKMAL